MVHYMRLNRCATFFVGAVTSVISSAAFAGGGADAGHEKTSAGLPQLDPTHFSSQIFGMLVVFAVSYYLFTKEVLPKIEAVLDRRAGIVDEDLSQAEKLNHQANKAKKHVEETLRDARNQARHDIETAQVESSHISGQRIDENDRILHVRLEQAEKAIEAAKDKALNDFQGSAVAVAREILEKLAALSLTEQQIATTLGGKTAQYEKSRG